VAVVRVAVKVAAVRATGAVGRAAAATVTVLLVERKVVAIQVVAERVREAAAMERVAAVTVMVAQAQARAAEAKGMEAARAN
jgi:hypothetical protein